jgi:hypothetical protein
MGGGTAGTEVVDDSAVDFLFGFHCARRTLVGTVDAFGIEPGSPTPELKAHGRGYGAGWRGFLSAMVRAHLLHAL